MSQRPSREDILKLSLDEYSLLYVHKDYRQTTRMCGRRGAYLSLAQQRRRYEHSHYFAPDFQRQLQRQLDWEKRRHSLEQTEQALRIEEERLMQLRLEQRRLERKRQQRVELLIQLLLHKVEEQRQLLGVSHKLFKLASIINRVQPKKEALPLIVKVEQEKLKTNRKLEPIEIKEEHGDSKASSTEELIAAIENQMKEERDMEDISSDMLYIPTSISLNTLQ